LWTNQLTGLYDFDLQLLPDPLAGGADGPVVSRCQGYSRYDGNPEQLGPAQAARGSIGKW
jgi:hypothetical protein